MVMLPIIQLRSADYRGVEGTARLRTRVHKQIYGVGNEPGTVIGSNAAALEKARAVDGARADDYA